MSLIPRLDRRSHVILYFIHASAWLISVFFLFFRLFSGYEFISLIPELFAVFVFSISFLCILNGRINCALNSAFFVPLLIYTFYLSDLREHSPESETIGLTLLLTVFVLVYQALFSVSVRKIILFFIEAQSLLLIQLNQSGKLEDYLSINQDFIRNPLLILLFLFGMILLIRGFYMKQLGEARENLQEIQKNIRELFMGIRYPAIHVRGDRNDSGDLTDLVVERVNPAFESVFGVRSHEARGQNADFVFLKAFNGEFSPTSFFITGLKHRREIYFENSGRWFNVHVLNPDAENFYTVFYETTHEKRILTELDESRQRYKVLLEAIPDIFFVIGRDGTYEDFVIKDVDQIKVQDNEIIGKTIFEVGFSEAMSGKIFECIQAAISMDTIETIEYALNTSNGTFMFEMRLARLNENSVISIARDITRRKMAEFRLEEAKEKAEKALRLKSVFLANLSHNIRTPMNIILGFSKMLGEDGLPDSEREFLIKGINQNSHLLLKMIDDTINLSKIETDTIELKTSQVNINSLMKDLYIHFSSILPDSRSISLEFLPDVANRDFSFVTDSSMLSEILKKLLDNAIKFSHSGLVRFGYMMKSTGQVEFYVEDEGPGIQKEELKHIFERFYIGTVHQENNLDSGLGLPIAQHFAALLGSELKVDSKIGRGSRFYFTLPFREGRGYLRIVS